MAADEYKDAIYTWIDKNQEEYCDIAHYLWEHPELGLEEYGACDRLVNVLVKYGFQAEKGAAGMPTAFIASFGSGNPVIAFNAEYDCLPGLSQESFIGHKQEILAGAPGHGCGHNLLGTAAVMAAIALHFVLKEQKAGGTIKVFGSPAEELCVGKPFMAREGCYDAVDCFLDWHPWSYNKAHYDTCGAYFNIKYHFKGKSCHGNSPWQGQSALDAAMLTGTAIEFLREHYEPAAADRANTINYTFSDTGPEFPSVVPDRATLWCIGRFNTSEQLEEILRRIDNCAAAGALATDTLTEKEFITATHEKLPNRTLSRVIYDNFAVLGAPSFTAEEQSMARAMQLEDGYAQTGLDTKLMEFGTSATVLCDTSEMSWKAPYATFWMSAAPDGGWHNWKVTSCAGSSIGRKTMLQASKLLAASGLDLFLQPALVQEAKAEWRQRMQDRSYHSLLPESTKPPLGINAAVMDKYRKGEGR